MQTFAPATKSSPAWRHVLLRVVIVIVGIEVGLVLITLPWTRLWEHSYWMVHLLPSHPRLWRLAHSSSLRGAITGLGFVNLWIAASQIVHFRR